MYETRRTVGCHYSLITKIIVRPSSSAAFPKILRLGLYSEAHPRLRFLQNGISESKGWKNNLLKTAKHDFLLRATQDAEPDFSVGSDPP